MNKEEWGALWAAVALTVLAIVLSFFAPAIAHGDDDRVILSVRTAREVAEACKAKGCGIYSNDQMIDIKRAARAEGAMDVVRLLDRHGCLKDNSV